MTPYRPTRGSSQRRHDVPFALVCAVACLLVAVQAGCSCSSADDPSRRASPAEIEAARRRFAERQAEQAKTNAEQQARAEAERKKAEEEHRQRVEAERQKREAQQREWQAKAQEQKQAEPEKPRFPENPIDWTKDDFPNARAAGEPRLVDAVAYLGETFPTSEPAVATLVELLRPPGPGGQPATRPLIEAIVVALGRNETRQATQALRDLVDGNVEAEMPSVARSRAMCMLADRDAGLFDDLLLAALRSADGDQRLAAATRNAYEWESDLLKLLDDRASPALRVRVAHYALEPTTSARQRGKLLELLTRPAPSNLSAQVILLASPTTEPAARTVLARQLAMVSSCALQRLQGMPANVTPAFSAGGRPTDGRPATYGITSYGVPTAASTAAGGTMGIYDDPNLLRYAPAALWTDQAAKLVVQSLFQLETLEGSPHHLQLAATIPVRRVREEWIATLRRNWRDGPGGLRKAGVPGQVIFDPALPVLMKTLPYATPEARDWRRHLFAASKGKSQPPRLHFEDERWYPLDQHKKQTAALEDNWADFLGETIWTLCARLQAAAEIEAAMLRTEAAGNLAERYAPIPLHEHARVVAFHQASLPGQLAELPGIDAPKLDPVRITYIRMVDNVPLRKIFSHYARHMPDSVVFTSARTGWIGSLASSETPGMVRSLDVFITRINQATLDVPDSHERLIIQVLCVECPELERGSALLPIGNSAHLTEN